MNAARTFVRIVFLVLEFGYGRNEVCSTHMRRITRCASECDQNIPTIRMEQLTRCAHPDTNAKLLEICAASARVCTVCTGP